MDSNIEVADHAKLEHKLRPMMRSRERRNDSMHRGIVRSETMVSYADSEPEVATQKIAAYLGNASYEIFLQL